MKYTTEKIHWTHKRDMRNFYQQGFSVDEISIMYNLAEFRVRQIVRGLTRPERIV